MEMHGAGQPRGNHDPYNNVGGDEGPNSEFCIKMRGLPFSATEHDIVDFFQGE